VDAARLLVYGLSFYATRFVTLSSEAAGLVSAATLSAFIGAFAGARLMKKITLRTIQIIVGVMLTFVGLGLASGLI